MAKAAPAPMGPTVPAGGPETSALCQKEGLSPGSPATKHLWGLLVLCLGWALGLITSPCRAGIPVTEVEKPWGTVIWSSGLSPSLLFPLPLLPIWLEFQRCPLT